MIGMTNSSNHDNSSKIVTWGGGYDTADFRNIRCPL